MKKIAKQVSKILADVGERGDRALLEYTAKFDGIRLSPSRLKIPQKQLRQAWQKTPPKVKKALLTARNNIRKFHRLQLPRNWQLELQPGCKLGQLFRPLSRVGIYVPGGTAPLVSTVLMTALPAQVAGVKELVMATPPPANTYILAAAYLAGVTEVYQVGGAQAIAALAYGTKTIPKVAKIVGPGNIYVTCAKQMVYGEVDIDMPAGPSEVLILADNRANPRYIAADLLSQLEHDPLSKAILVTTSVKTAYGVITEIKKQLPGLSRKRIIKKAIPKGLQMIKAASLNAAIDVINNIAPEHLQLMIKNARKIIPRINNAGIILIGENTPVALSDFLAGTNHVLPTAGSAVSFPGLNTWDFIKPVSTLEYSKKALRKASKNIDVFAQIEGLDAHAKSVACRK